MKTTKLALMAAGLAPALVMAQEQAPAATTTNAAAGQWAAGICMAVAAALVGYSQSRAAVAALDGIARNPSASGALFTPLILSLALMESIALLAFVIAGKLSGLF